MIAEKRPRGRPRKHPEGAKSPSVSRQTLKVLGKRVWGRKDAMPGALIAANTLTTEQINFALHAGLAVWLGDAQAELDALDRQRLGAQKAAAESEMQRFDSMLEEDREFARNQDPDEGADVI